MKPSPYLRFTVLLLAALPLSCIDPTEPVFQLEDPFLLVEGRVLAGTGLGEVRVQESERSGNRQDFGPVAGAMVSLESDDGRSVDWEPAETPGAYRPPPTAAVAAGERWSLRVRLPDGTEIISAPETVPTAVPLTAVDLRFEQESVFDEGARRFIPRFEVFADYDDPAGETNFYAYDFRYWEEIIICASCPLGRYREGECRRDRSVQPRYDYFCDTEECYSITENDVVIVGDDELTDGSAVTGFPLGGVPFNSFGGLLVEVELLSLTRAGYDYARVVRDLTTGNAGLNPTTPAVLSGNLRNVDPAGRTVLGFFGAAAVSRARRFLVQDENTGDPLPFDERIYPEPQVGLFVPPRAPCDVPGRTSVRPAGWGG